MPKLVTAVWNGNPGGATRASRRPCRYRAFVPDRLAELDLTLSPQAAADLVDVETSIRQLNSASLPAVSLEPLARFLLRAEAVASSNIEGLRINVRRLARSEAELREGWTSSDDVAAAVLGNIRALDRALSLAGNADQPITIDTLKAIHTALLTGTRDESWAGVIREEQNWVGGVNPCSAVFVPPPADEVIGLLDDLVDYLNSTEHPALLQAAVAHAQFETIHPFADGNGRTGRALIQLVLRRRGLASAIAPPISLILATQTDRYIGALMATRQIPSSRAGFMQWIELFVDASARACQDSVDFSHQLANLEQQNRNLIGRIRSNSAADLLIAALPAIPVFTVKTAAQFVGRSEVAVSAAVARLADAGIIRQVKVGRRNRAFEATGLFEIFTGFERQLASPDFDTFLSAPVRPVPARPTHEG